MKVGRNGTVIDSDSAVISVYDHGFLYGMGLFETFRTYGGQPYLLQRHLNRLKDGCRLVGIRYEPDETALRRWLQELLQANGLEDGYVRLTVSAGTGELGLPVGDYEEPVVLLLVKALPPRSESLYRDGKALRLLKTRRNSPESEVRLKSLHYMNNIIAKRELSRSGAPEGAEGLMLSLDGKLAEGIVSNLFFSKAGIIYTPQISTGILPGITRQRVMELAHELGMSVQEGEYNWAQLQTADEVWLTNSVQELVPVTTLINDQGEARRVGSGQIGSLTQRLLRHYRKETDG